MSDADSNDARATMLENLKLLDEDLQREFAKIEEIHQLFSKKNPWVKLYSTYNRQEEIKEQIVGKYVAKVMVYRFERVTLIPCYFEWFEKLPKEWFAEWEG